MQPLACTFRHAEHLPVSHWNASQETKQWKYQIVLENGGKDLTLVFDFQFQKDFGGCKGGTHSFTRVSPSWHAIENRMQGSFFDVSSEYNQDNRAEPSPQVNWQALQSSVVEEKSEGALELIWMYQQEISTMDGRGVVWDLYKTESNVCTGTYVYNIIKYHIFLS